MHGRPRATQGPDPARQRDEQAKIASLQSLLEEVLHNHRQRNYSKKALQQNSGLLETNPEVYTAWNYRKVAVTHLLESQQDEAARKSVLDEELQVVERALMRNFKSYGAWHHRKWVIQFGLSSLNREYQLLDKLLTSDARNFHGWNYRRFLARVKKATEDQELQYTIKKINENFSNYSAWHNRSALLSKQFIDKVIEKDKWLEVLTEEYDLVKQAFFTEPEDQSGWFYLMWLLGQTVIPSRPLLTGFWPSNGSLVLLNSDAPPKTSFWSYKSPLSKKSYCNNCSLCIALCFSKPVLGVDSTTVSISSSPEVQCLGSGVSWTPLFDSADGSRFWTANLTASSKGFKDAALYTIFIDVGGGSPGISSKDGPFFGENRFSFNVEVQVTSSGAAHEEDNVLDSCVVWPSESAKQSISSCEQIMEDVPNGLQLDSNRSHEIAADWQLKTLEAQIDTCRELLDLEKDSKWTMLILARLLLAHDNLVSSLNIQKPHMDEVRRLYEELIKVDPTHGRYYDEQISLLSFDQITCSLNNLSRYWWEFQSSEDNHEGWLRLNHLSLSKLAHFERLIWVQRLDLSSNKLQSLEGIEMLQLLVSLDVSHNLLCSVTSLWPIRFVPNLGALNIKCNQIGANTIDTNRYFLPSALNNTSERDSSGSSGYPNSPHLWEVLELFSGMALRQLEIFGNPIANDDSCRSQIIQALPSLVWLDGMRVSS